MPGGARSNEKDGVYSSSPVSEFSEEEAAADAQIPTTDARTDTASRRGKEMTPARNRTTPHTKAQGNYAGWPHHWRGQRAT